MPSGFVGSQRSPGTRKRWAGTVVVVAPAEVCEPPDEGVVPDAFELLLEQAAAAVAAAATAEAARKFRRVIVR